MVRLAKALVVVALSSIGLADPSWAQTSSRPSRPTAEMSRTDGKPNVLIVSIDSLRRDVVGCYDARLPYAPGATPTPHLDRLAQDGMRMADAYAPSSWTLPSHVSLFTGQSTVVHHVETDLTRLSADRPTLAETLHAAGYHTAGVFSGPYLEPEWGLGRGFERYVAAYGPDVATASRALGGLDDDIEAAECRGDLATATELNWRRRSEYERVRALSHGDVSSDRVTRDALDAITSMTDAGAPWFAFVHYFDVHFDYVPPPPWETAFDPDYRGNVTGREFIDNPGIAEPDPNVLEGWVRHVSDRDLDHVRALYAGEVAWVDEHVGRLLRHLDETGVAERTLVIVVSDHGDEFFEHDGIGHRRNLAEEVIRIPMIVRFPGVVRPGGEGRGLVSLADVARTVLDLVGVPAPTAMSGVGFADVLRGGDPGTKRSAISRLVRLYEGVATYHDEQLPIRTAVVHEAFRRGSIKILRRRRWLLVPPALPEDERVALERHANQQFRREELAWIDLERAPSEPAAGYSTDFSVPAAHKALGAYRQRYRRLEATDLTGDRDQHVSGALRSQLEGLGYLDGRSARSTNTRFVLPQPGDRRAPAPAEIEGTPSSQR